MIEPPNVPMFEPPKRPSGGAVIAFFVAVVVAGVLVVVFGTKSNHDTPSILAFGGTVIVAVITAVTTWVTTNYRQAQQLTAEQARHRESLDGEDARFRARLQHERGLQDIQHMLQLFDECAASYERAAVATRRAAVTIVKPVAEWEAGAIGAASDAETDVSDQLHRLQIRFGPTHDVVTTFRSLDDAVWDRIRSLFAVSKANRPMTADEDKEDTGRATACEVAFDRFSDAARAEVGVSEQRVAAG